MRASDTVAPALIVMLLGAWLFAEAFIPQSGAFEKHWPLLIVATGLCFILGYVVGSGSWQLFLGLVSTLGGLPLWLFTAGLLPWSLLDTIWPVFLVSAGVACLAYMAAAPQAPWPLLVPALGAIAAGGGGLLHSLGLLVEDPLQQIRLIWPLLLFVTGFLGLLQAMWHGLTGHRSRA
ncbi:MAG: hypothetical protein ACYC5O_05345 [Anaerolineae bacterium]